ncbi:MAG: hypothetical protein K2Z81_04670, partial [Cyanobacteria bacterium]|nr:hypothetical protein [Cyanobacteriota bacterium]
KLTESARGDGLEGKDSGQDSPENLQQKLEKARQFYSEEQLRTALVNWTAYQALGEEAFKYTGGTDKVEGSEWVDLSSYRITSDTFNAMPEFVRKQLLGTESPIPSHTYLGVPTTAAYHGQPTGKPMTSESWHKLSVDMRRTIAGDPLYPEQAGPPAELRPIRLTAQDMSNPQTKEILNAVYKVAPNKMTFEDWSALPLSVRKLVTGDPFLSQKATQPDVLHPIALNQHDFSDSNVRQIIEKYYVLGKQELTIPNPRNNFIPAEMLKEINEVSLRELLTKGREVEALEAGLLLSDLELTGEQINRLPDRVKLYLYGTIDQFPPDMRLRFPKLEKGVEADAQPDKPPSLMLRATTFNDMLTGEHRRMLTERQKVTAEKLLDELAEGKVKPGSSTGFLLDPQFSERLKKDLKEAKIDQQKNQLGLELNADSLRQKEEALARQVRRGMDFLSSVWEMNRELNLAEDKANRNLDKNLGLQSPQRKPLPTDAKSSYQLEQERLLKELNERPDNVFYDEEKKQRVLNLELAIDTFKYADNLERGNWKTAASEARKALAAYGEQGLKQSDCLHEALFKICTNPSDPDAGILQKDKTALPDILRMQTPQSMSLNDAIAKLTRLPKGEKEAQAQRLEALRAIDNNPALAEAVRWQQYISSDANFVGIAAGGGTQCPELFRKGQERALQLLGKLRDLAVDKEPQNAINDLYTFRDQLKKALDSKEPAITDKESRQSLEKKVFTLDQMLRLLDINYVQRNPGVIEGERANKLAALNAEKKHLEECQSYWSSSKSLNLGKAVETGRGEDIWNDYAEADQTKFDVVGRGAGSQFDPVSKRHYKDDGTTRTYFRYGQDEQLKEIAKRLPEVQAQIEATARQTTPYEALKETAGKMIEASSHPDTWAEWLKRDGAIQIGTVLVTVALMALVPEGFPLWIAAIGIGTAGVATAEGIRDFQHQAGLRPAEDRAALMKALDGKTQVVNPDGSLRTYNLLDAGGQYAKDIAISSLIFYLGVRGSAELAFLTKTLGSGFTAAEWEAMVEASTALRMGPEYANASVLERFIASAPQHLRTMLMFTAASDLTKIGLHEAAKSMFGQDIPPEMEPFIDLAIFILLGGAMGGVMTHEASVSVERLAVENRLIKPELRDRGYRTTVAEGVSGNTKILLMDPQGRIMCAGSAEKIQQFSRELAGKQPAQAEFTTEEYLKKAQHDQLLPERVKNAGFRTRVAENGDTIVIDQSGKVILTGDAASVLKQVNAQLRGMPAAVDAAALSARLSKTGNGLGVLPNPMPMAADAIKSGATMAALSSDRAIPVINNNGSEQTRGFAIKGDNGTTFIRLTENGAGAKSGVPLGGV